MQPGTEQEFVIDMDAIADLGSDQPKPDFYYSSESQQTRYTCGHCGDFNDIRGRYGYCASCGCRNNAQLVKASFIRLRERLNSGQAALEDAVKAAVSELDSCCRDIAAQIARRIPMRPNRKAELERMLFHDLESASISKMKSMFEIDLLAGVDVPFIRLMLNRRHIFEHNASVADQRYVDQSGDKEARLGVLVSEMQANAHQLIGSLSRVVENFDADFQAIFHPTEWPIKYFERTKKGKRS